MSFGVQKSSGGGACSSRESLEGRIRDFSARFDRVSVENLDWQRCLELYDSPKTFFFIDPPYVGGKQKAYKSWTLADFQILCDVLANLKGRWVLTCSDSADMRKVFAGCRITAVDRSLGIAIQKEKRGRYLELIIQNPI
jgi:DNA adenine methylase